MREGEGHIQIRMGSGVYISSRPRPIHEAIDHNDSEGPLEILQARCLIESGIAEESARLATTEGLMRIDAILERMQGALDDGAVALASDLDFIRRLPTSLAIRRSSSSPA